MDGGRMEDVVWMQDRWVQDGWNTDGGWMQDGRNNTLQFISRGRQYSIKEEQQDKKGKGEGSTLPLAQLSVDELSQDN